MEKVHLDLKTYLQKNIFPSRTVLVFPPFNGFRRFLIHKLIEDSFASSEVAAFSIGQDISRRIVVCYKGLIREDHNTTPTSFLQKPRLTMIEKERTSQQQKLTPSAAVYRPPAARPTEPRQNAGDIPPESKRNRVRRPDQQMYVPRPKRASYSNEEQRSRSRSSSRTSLESDSCEKRIRSSPFKSEERRIPDSNDPVQSNDLLSDKDRTQLPAMLPNGIETLNEEDNNALSTAERLKSSANLTHIQDELLIKAEVNRTSEIATSTDLIDKIMTSSNEESTVSGVLRTDLPQLTNRLLDSSSRNFCEYDKTITANELQMDCCKHDSNTITNTCIEKSDESRATDTSTEKLVSDDKRTEKAFSNTIKTEEQDVTDSQSVIGSVQMDSVEKKGSTKSEAMETISISSDSRGDQSSNSPTTDDSRSSDSSSDSNTQQRHCKRRSCEKMETGHSFNSENKKGTSTNKTTSKDHNLKNRRIFPTVPVSDVLIISDTSSEDNSITNNSQPKGEELKKRVKTSLSAKDNKIDIPLKTVNTVEPDECDWESLYDDSGECLVPSLMEELTNSVGSVRVTSVDSDYRPYQSVEERTNDGECVIEIYDFPAEFKTTDLFNIFAAYRNKNFQIKWVDDTHALGVFPSPIMADEVLACTLPFVKTRPLRLGTVESRNKARSLVLPPLPSIERPKTCTALARRLVSGALGLRLPTSTQDREKERQVLKEAREKRRLEAKQREAAWDGTLTSNNCI